MPVVVERTKELSAGPVKMVVSTPGSLRRVITAAIVLTIPLWLGWGYTAHGLAFTPDSATYLAGADSLISKGEYLGLSWQPVAWWPPAYPLALAAVQLFGASPGLAARLINIVAIAGASLLVYRLGRDTNLARPGASALAILLALSPPIVGVSHYVLSEILFVAVVCGAAGRLLRALRTGRVWDAWVSGALFGLAGLTRYAAVPFAVAAASSLLLFAPPSRGWRKRARGFLAVSMGAGLPLALWGLRNLVRCGTLTGQRGPGGEPWTRIPEALGATLCSWAGVSVPSLEGELGLVALVGLTAVVLIAVAESARGGEGWAHCGYFALSALFYLSFMGVSGVTAGAEFMTSRMLLPAFPFLWLCGGQSLLIARRTLHLSPPVAGSGAVILALAAGFAFLPGASRAVQGPRWLDFGSDLSRSETLSWVRDNVKGEKIVANHPAAVYLLLGRRAFMSPRRFQYLMPTTSTDDMRWLSAGLPPGESACLVWLEYRIGPQHLRPEELGKPFEVSLLRKLSDGAVYTVRVAD